jgi:hypothetical protein
MSRKVPPLHTNLIDIDTTIKYSKCSPRHSVPCP